MNSQNCVSGTLQKISVVTNRQRNSRFTASAVLTIGELQNATVGFCNLPAHNQAYAAAAVLGREEGYEEVVAVEKTWSFITDEDFHAPRIGAPSDLNRPRMLQRGIQRSIHSVTHKIDEQLLQLVRIGVDCSVRAFQGLYLETPFQ